jgi:hypothetical protein
MLVLLPPRREVDADILSRPPTVHLDTTQIIVGRLQLFGKARQPKSASTVHSRHVLIRLVRARTPFPMCRLSELPAAAAVHSSH